jgi:hypothetical protein
VKLTTHLHIVPRSKNAWSYTATPPISLHGVVLSPFLRYQLNEGLNRPQHKENENMDRKFFRNVVKLTPWIRVLLEKLIVPQQIKKFPVFYGTRMFITVFTIARHWSLS